MSLERLLARVPEGWTEVEYAGARWGLRRTSRAGGRAVAIWAEELGGTAYVSANVYLTRRPTLRPCEMPAADVLAFLAGWRSSGSQPPHPPHAG